jgi:site-specific recombinase XerD
LAEYAKGFGDHLARQGYAEGSIRQQLGLISQLSRWLTAEGLGAKGLTELEAERFLAARRARGVRLFRSLLALEPVIGYLRGLGVAPLPAALAPSTPVDEVVERYRRYLLVERVLTPGSVRTYLQSVRPFLARFERDGRLQFERITAAEVSAFVLAEASRRPGTSIGSVATTLRSLLGFLHVEGMLERSLRGGSRRGCVAWGGSAEAARGRRTARAAGQL